MHYRFLYYNFVAIKKINLATNRFTIMLPGFSIEYASEQHLVFAKQICEEMASSARVRGTGISKRKPEQIMQKILDKKAVIAISEAGEWAGFCYIEAWENNRFVSNSGLIVAPRFRQSGLGRAIKRKIFELSRQRFPNARIFGLTTGAAVMKINSELGYEPAVYSEIPHDEKFWEGCKSCVNYPILLSKNKKNCLCTAMVFDPVSPKTQNQVSLPLIKAIP